jgi:hypothetical protein
MNIVSEYMCNYPEYDENKCPPGTGSKSRVSPVHRIIKHLYRREGVGDQTHI